jgi:lipopolysaccharide biosynthesis glycosyltransferase
MNICCICDDNYVLPLRVMLDSMSRHNDDVVLWLVYSDIQESNIGLIAGDVSRYGWEFRPTKLDGRVLELCESLPRIGRFSKEVYYRMFIPWVLADCDRVLYLDCDMLVCGPLADLYSLDMAGSTIAAVPDSSADVEGENMKRLGLSGRYHNSGVLLFDCALIRACLSEEEMSLRIAETAKRSNLVFPDQDLINLIYQGKIFELGKVWNSPASLTSVLDMLAHRSQFGQVKVFHFYSEAKPWRADYIGWLVFKYWRHLKKFLSKTERRDYWRRKAFVRSQLSRLLNRVKGGSRGDE